VLDVFSLMKRKWSASSWTRSNVYVYVYRVVIYASVSPGLRDLESGICRTDRSMRMRSAKGMEATIHRHVRDLGGRARRTEHPNRTRSVYLPDLLHPRLNPPLLGQHSCLCQRIRLARTLIFHRLRPVATDGTASSDVDGAIREGIHGMLVPQAREVDELLFRRARVSWGGSRSWSRSDALGSSRSLSHSAGLAGGSVDVEMVRRATRVDS